MEIGMTIGSRTTIKITSLGEWLNVKRMWIFVLVFVAGTITGFIAQYATFGGTDRARITALEEQLKSRNDKLERCTDDLINALHTNTPSDTKPAGAPK
ncbi:MAG: hypothetical protein NVS1B11_14880 [Terriglobales bacterium]